MRLIIFHLTGIKCYYHASGINTDVSHKTFLEKFDALLLPETYTNPKKISKNKFKFKDKPWITSVSQKSIPIKNHHLSKFIRLKDPSKKKRKPKIKQKEYRNLLSTLLKQSKQFH